MRGYRVAIVNPIAAFGRRVREVLDERSFPVIELKLFQTGGQADATLTHFHEEVVVTQPLDPDLFPHLDVMFFGGEEAESHREQWEAARREGLLTLVSGASGIEAPVVASGVNEARIPPAARLLVAARPAAILIGAILSGLARSLEMVEACATVLIPASERGEGGVEELHQQVVNILNFKPPPTEVFSEPLAFNLLLAGGAAGVESESVAREAAHLAGAGAPVAVSLVRAPIFHAYAVSLWVRLAGTPGVEEVAKAAAQSARIARARKMPPRHPSPVSVAETTRIHVSGVRAEPSLPGSFWIWAVADARALDAAESAVRVAERLLGVSRDRR